jgi:hypothetical protein
MNCKTSSKFWNVTTSMNIHPVILQINFNSYRKLGLHVKEVRLFQNTTYMVHAGNWDYQFQIFLDLITLKPIMRAFHLIWYFLFSDIYFHEIVIKNVMKINGWLIFLCWKKCSWWFITNFEMFFQICWFVVKVKAC